MTQTLARSVPSSFINALLQPAYYAPLSPPFLVSFLALFEHVVRLPSQCSKTAVRCELYVIKIWCRLGKSRDAAHPHVLIICCYGITWVRPPVSEDSQSQQECIACAAAVASLEEATNGHDTGWKSVSLSASGVHLKSSLCVADHMNKPFPSFYLLQVRQRLLVSVS